MEFPDKEKEQYEHLKEKLKEKNGIDASDKQWAKKLSIPESILIYVRYIPAKSVKSSGQ